MPKMSVTLEMTMSNNKIRRTMNHQKQSQTKPNYSVFTRVNSWLNSKQSQTKPNLVPPVRQSLGEGGSRGNHQNNYSLRTGVRLYSGFGFFCADLGEAFVSEDDSERQENPIRNPYKKAIR